VETLAENADRYEEELRVNLDLDEVQQASEEGVSDV